MRKENITLRALRHYNAYNTKYFPLRFLTILFENLSPYFNLWMSSEIVTALYQGRTRTELIQLVAVTLLGNLLIRIAEAFFKRAVQTEEEVLKNNEAAAFYQKTLSLDYDKLENPDFRQLRRKIRENSYTNLYGVEHMRLCLEKLLQAAVNIFLCLFLFLEMLGKILTLSARLLPLCLLALLIGSLALTILLQNKCNAKCALLWKETGSLMVQENRLGKGFPGGGMDNRLYRQQKILDIYNKKMHDMHLSAFSGTNQKLFRLQIPVYIASKLPELFAYLIVCFYCTLGAFPVGSVIKYVGYLTNLISHVNSIFFHLGNLKNNEPFLETYMEYFDIPNDMYQGSLAVEKRSDKKFDIEFKNVSFRYAGSDRDALKDVNLKVKVGERLAVVGRNGSGKTTFIKLLCRLYDPTAGEIFMNDFNVRKYDYRQYLDLFSAVFQDYNLLALPLGNNVSSAAAWDSAKAEALLQEVGFGSRYQELPRKLDTPLYKNFDEDGVNISGGEAQKIALARALYKDAPFIILDEPTAALDPIAEAEIYAKFDQIVGDKTAIYISHRLSSCRFCDKIAVFDEGRIVQIGTHEELLADVQGKYYELWHAQAQYYADGQ